MSTDDIKPEQKPKSPLASLNKIVRDGVFVPDAVARSRMAICKKCEFLTSANFCSKCKCMMNIKTRIAVAKCPIGKWVPYTGPAAKS